MISDVVPGKDVAWDAQHLWEFLKHRSRTCKPSTVISIMSALKHFGARHNFMLPTAKGEQPSVLRWQIRGMRKQLRLDAAKHRQVDEPITNPCVPLGSASVSMMFAAF